MALTAGTRLGPYEIAAQIDQVHVKYEAWEKETL